MYSPSAARSVQHKDEGVSFEKPRGLVRGQLALPESSTEMTPLTLARNCGATSRQRSHYAAAIAFWMSSLVCPVRSFDSSPASTSFSFEW